MKRTYSTNKLDVNHDEDEVAGVTLPKDTDGNIIHVGDYVRVTPPDRVERMDRKRTIEVKELVLTAKGEWLVKGGVPIGLYHPSECQVDEDRTRLKESKESLDDLYRCVDDLSDEQIHDRLDHLTVDLTELLDVYAKRVGSYDYDGFEEGWGW